ncbi:hypothetical protein [Pseudoduganella violacea]|uniref:Uncharacterized protein n=1 Tax=Pseudoduganella violacea TaxID=1715466 RepID=A0A7W5BDG7_9BURK|nr:hypothetical protein [Pseudoduganella violacea]MBB3121197.1 hypothetical protein [Pseudoduganella violacea]
MNNAVSIDDLSVVARQCIAVTCLQRFCRRYQIAHPALSQFIDHVWKVGQADRETFVAWDMGFSALPITGLGDEWPEDVRAAIPEDIYDTLAGLVDHVLETSACTWYGGDLPTTRRQLEIVLSICEQHGVVKPDFRQYTQAQAQLRGGWGPVLTDEEINAWRGLA